LSLVRVGSNHAGDEGAKIIGKFLKNSALSSLNLGNFTLTSKNPIRSVMKALTKFGKA